MSRKLGIIFTVLGMLLALGAVSILFLPAAKMTLGDQTTTATGIKLAFTWWEGDVKVCGMSINLLPYVFLGSGVIYSLGAAIGKTPRFARVCATICFIAAAVMFFFCIKLADFYPNLEGEDKDAAAAFLKDNLKLGIGAYIAVGLSAAAALITFISVFSRSYDYMPADEEEGDPLSNGQRPDSRERSDSRQSPDDKPYPDNGPYSNNGPYSGSGSYYNNNPYRY